MGGRAPALALALSVAGCILQNPAFDGDTIASDSDSGTGTGTDSASTNQSTIGDTESAPLCDGEACLYLDPPPIACYEFEELSGVLVDGRNCDRDGTLSGLAAVPGVHDQGVVVTDASKIAVPGGVWPRLGSFTLTAWIALTDQEYSAPMTLLAKAGHFSVSLTPPPEPLMNWKVTCAVADNTLIAEEADLYTDGKWHLVTCTCVAPADDEGTCDEILITVNGDLKSSDGGLSKPPENDAALEIAPSFDGCVDSIQVWDRALTQAELDALYEAGNAAPNTPCPPP